MNSFEIQNEQLIKGDINGIDEDLLSDTKNKSRSKRIKLLILIAGILTIIIASIILMMIFLKKDKNVSTKEKENEGSLSGGNPVIRSNFSSYKDEKFPLSISFSDYLTKGYRESHSAFEDSEPGRHDIFEYLYESLSKENKLDLSLDLLGPSGGSFDCKKEVISSLEREKVFEHFIGSKKKEFYWSVSLLVKKKKVRIEENSTIKVKADVENRLLAIIEDNSNYPDSESKANKLYEEIFEKYGFYVPLEITYGGRFELTFQTESSKEGTDIASNLIKALKGLIINDSGGISGTYDYDIELMKRINITKTTIKLLGGNYPAQKIEDIEGWFNSLKEENYAIVSFSGKSYLWDYFSDDAKKKFQPYINIIKTKTDIFFEKHQLLEKLLKEHTEPKWTEGDGDDNNHRFGDGYCEYDYIEKTVEKVDKDDWFGSKITYKGSLKGKNQIIVGYELYACNDNNYVGSDQGDFKVNSDPILTKDYDFYFYNYPLGTRNTWEITLCYVDLDKNEIIKKNLKEIY